MFHAMFSIMLTLGQKLSTTRLVDNFINRTALGFKCLYLGAYTLWVLSFGGLLFNMPLAGTLFLLSILLVLYVNVLDIAINQKVNSLLNLHDIRYSVRSSELYMRGNKFGETVVKMNPRRPIREEINKVLENPPD